MSSRQTRTFICSFSGPLLKLIKTELTSSFPASLLGHKMRGGSGLLLTPPISTFTLNQPAIQCCSLQFSNLSPLHLHFLYLIHAHTQLSYLQSCPNSANCWVPRTYLCHPFAENQSIAPHFLQEENPNSSAWHVRVYDPSLPTSLTLPPPTAQGTLWTSACWFLLLSQRGVVLSLCPVSKLPLPLLAMFQNSTWQSLRNLLWPPPSVYSRLNALYTLYIPLLQYLWHYIITVALTHLFPHRTISFILASLTAST